MRPNGDDSTSPMPTAHLASDYSLQKNKTRSPTSYTHSRLSAGQQHVAVPQFVSFTNTSKLLCHLSERIIEIMNDRDYHNPFLNCLSSDIVCEASNAGRAKVIAAHRRLVEHMPDYRNEVQHATCIVDRDGGRATVVMTMKVTGFKYDTLRQNIADFIWTRTEDRWSCASYSVLGGIEEFD